MKNRPAQRAIDMPAPARGPTVTAVRRGVPVIVYLLLLAIGIPWYWPADDVTLIAGMPSWVAVAIGTSTLASCYTAYLLYSAWLGNGDERT